jgi:aminoglycoside 3-N-acetyltransferase
MLHVAESIANVPYSVEHPCLVNIDGSPTRIMVAETDHCCPGFHRMDAWLNSRALQREGSVGNAGGKLSNAADIVAIAVEHLTEDPLVFLCPAKRRLPGVRRSASERHAKRDMKADRLGDRRERRQREA